MKIKEVRKLYPVDLRSLCIREDFYTKGTNEEYAKLFNMIPEKNVTKLAIYKLACNICDHSETHGFERSEYIEHVMYLINKKCVTFFEICED